MIKINKHSTVTAATLILLLSSTAIAKKRWDAPRIVTWNCSGCHGIDGNAQPPYIPRLAGLSADYAERKMTEFRAAPLPAVDEMFSRLIKPVSAKPGVSSIDERINMIGMAHAATAEETKLSAEWYAAQKPEPGRSGNAALIEQGELLFRKGLPAQGLLACQTCHGASGKGSSKIPRLAGQNGSYLLSSLEKFRVGDRQHAPEMTTVVEHVDVEIFRALAAYLQSR